jgi:hypothetical protein
MNHPESSVVVQAPTKPQGLAQIPHRDGATYVHELDGQRLHRQHNRVCALMRDGVWRTLAEIAAATGDPEASVSARLRDLRKPRFGSYLVDRQRRGPGLFEYRLRVGQLELPA